MDKEMFEILENIRKEYIHNKQKLIEMKKTFYELCKEKTDIENELMDEITRMVNEQGKSKFTNQVQRDVYFKGEIEKMLDDPENEYTIISASIDNLDMDIRNLEIAIEDLHIQIKIYDIVTRK